MATCGRHFERALGLRLAFDFGQIRIAGKSRRWRHGEGCEDFAAGEVGADLQQVFLDLRKRIGTTTVLVTHDHRDHMDLPTIARLPDSATYVCGLGNGARLAR